jgi:hypothetical protein
LIANTTSVLRKRKAKKAINVPPVFCGNRDSREADILENDPIAIPPIF